MGVPRIFQAVSVALSQPLPAPTRMTQLVSISVQGPPNTSTRMTQLVSISVQGPPNTPTRINQLVTISVCQNGRNVLNLGNPINLNCWQPCTAYAFGGIVVYLGSNAK